MISRLSLSEDVSRCRIVLLSAVEVQVLPDYEQELTEI